MQYMLNDFVQSKHRSQEIYDCGLKSYVRAQHKVIKGKVYYVLCLANVVNLRRRTNETINNNYKSTGKFRKLIELLLTKAKEYNYDGVYVECVVNEFLPQKLIEYGFEQVNAPDQFDDFVEYNFFKQIK